MSFRDIYKREPIRDLKWIIPFGKWQGTALEDVIEHDSQYIVWLLNNTDLDFHADILDLAERTVEQIEDDRYQV